MSVYVDLPFEFNGKQWSHMVADTPEELETMRKRLGLKFTWMHVSNVKGVLIPHYDLVASKRLLAIKYGAIEVTSPDILNMYLPEDRFD